MSHRSIIILLRKIIKHTDPKISIYGTLPLKRAIRLLDMNDLKLLKKISCPNYALNDSGIQKFSELRDRMSKTYLHSGGSMAFTIEWLKLVTKDLRL
jgi:hypothetical protein